MTEEHLKSSLTADEQWPDCTCGQKFMKTKGFLVETILPSAVSTGNGGQRGRLLFAQASVCSSEDSQDSVVKLPAPIAEVLIGMS